MLTDRETTIAYHCPACGLAIISPVNIFSIAGDLLRLKCECGQSELLIKIARDRKVRLTVPCLACPTPHSYTLSSTSFFNKDIFTLSCTLSGIDICFFGSRGRVLNALRQNERELMDMMAAENASFPSDHGEEELHTFDELGGEKSDDLEERLSGMSINYRHVERVLSHIAQLLRQDKVRCRCGGSKITASVIETGVVLSCESCDALHFIACAQEQDVEKFEKVEGIVI